MKRIGRDFFLRDTLTVARELVGTVLCRRTAEGVTRGVIVETEAYLGERDDAAHTYKGRSERTRVAWKAGGKAYVYLIYGMYCCFNITAGPEDCPEMVLVRALQPVDGLDIMAARRGTDQEKNLCSGPGKLCMAMDIGRALYGEDLCESDGLWLERGTAPARIAATPRINIDYAERCKNEPWRFIDPDSSYLSVRYKG